MIRLAGTNHVSQPAQAARRQIPHDLVKLEPDSKYVPRTRALDCPGGK